MRAFERSCGILMILLLALLPALGGAQADEASEAAALAEGICQQAAELEPEITQLLLSLQTDTRHLIGLEFRLKTPESTARKILTDAHDMEISLEEAALGIHDALRYTFCIDDADYTASVNEIMRAIVDHGCAVYRFKNFWGNTGYKGINAQLQMPDGQIFELQLHTQDSYDAKEVKTHALYEIVRSEEASEEERDTAAAEMLAVFTQVVPPEGAVDISWPENPVQ